MEIKAGHCLCGSVQFAYKGHENWVAHCEREGESEGSAGLAVFVRADSGQDGRGGQGVRQLTDIDSPGEQRKVRYQGAVGWVQLQAEEAVEQDLLNCSEVPAADEGHQEGARQKAEGAERGGWWGEEGGVCPVITTP